MSRPRIDLQKLRSRLRQQKNDTIFAMLDVLVAFELLFELMEEAASGERDIVFFADEGGVWAFGIDWERVGAAWLTCLAVAKVDGTRADHLAPTLQRCGGDQGGVGCELARAARRRGIPPG